MIVSLTTWLGLACANPLDAWGPYVGDGTLGLNPNLYRSTTGDTELQGIAGLGLGAGFDVQASVAATVGPNPTAPGPMELLPRWFPLEGVGLVLHGLWAPGQARLGPELHLTQPVGEQLMAFVDGGGGWTWRPDGPGTHQAFLVAGVEWVAPPHLRPFLESSTESVGGQPTAVYLTPGLYVLVDNVGDQEISMGLRLPVAGGVPPVAGVWYNRNLSLRR